MSDALWDERDAGEAGKAERDYHHSAIEQQAQLVLRHRQDLAALKTDLAARRAEWERDNASLIRLVAEQTEALALAEDELRLRAIKAYQRTNQKKAGPGAAIRMVRKVMYDTKEAWKWCMDHNMFLKVDYPAFERLARDSKEPSLRALVTVIEEPQATIDGDLAKTLGVA